ncbi:MAG: hypothetical protein P8I27_13525 [Pirellulaceae bacterium]|nr:hypothetical protein [Pirellulaceae bacterium]
MRPSVNQPNARIGERKLNCSELATKIQKDHPDASPTYVARQCLMLLNTVGAATDLHDQELYQTTLSDCKLQYQAATDQHAATTQELEDLARSDPSAFNPEQIWILVRAIKVQSQILKLYAGSAVPTIS